MRNEFIDRGLSPVAGRLVIALAAIVLVCAAPYPARAQSAVQAPAPATAPAVSPASSTPVASVAPLQTAATGPILPANTVVELEMVDPISSKTSKRDDFFKLRVVADVKVGEQVVIPAGTPAVGQVVHAQKSGGGGKPGELILAARHIDLPQGQIKLHSSFGAAGKDRTNASMAVSVALGVMGLFVHGKNIDLPVGSALSARVAEDTPITASP
jgi:hypothetical protein